jgi:hypothetical protein
MKQEGLIETSNIQESEIGEELKPELKSEIWFDVKYVKKMS